MSTAVNRALLKLGYVTPEILIRSLDDPEYKRRKAAALALGEYKESPVIKALIKELGNLHGSEHYGFRADIHEAAVKASVKIGQPAIPCLREIRRFEPSSKDQKI